MHTDGLNYVERCELTEDLLAQLVMTNDFEMHRADKINSADGGALSSPVFYHKMHTWRAGDTSSIVLPPKEQKISNVSAFR